MCSLLVLIMETICFKGGNTLFHRQKQSVSIITIPMKQSHLSIGDAI